MSEKTKICRYCKKPYDGRASEHVFPKGMGGPSIFMDNVCQHCNQKFSEYERVLMRDSPVAFMRSVEGVDGYRRSDIPPGAFLAPILLTFDEHSQVAYEAGQRYQDNFVRPQFLLIQNAFYIEGDTLDNLQKLDKKFAYWKKEVRLAVVKIDLDDNESLEWIELVDKGTTYEALAKPLGTKSKEAIKIDILPVSHPLFAFLPPRLFLSDLSELRIRARSLEEAKDFLIRLMNYTRVRVALKSYHQASPTHPIISVSQNFKGLQFSQCIIKIGINCLMHCYQSFQDDNALDKCISFVMTGDGVIKLNHAPKDKVKDSNEGTHNLFFQQMTYGMNVRISFFNGVGDAFSFDVIGLRVMKPGEFNRLVIDYKSHTMEFQDKAKFFASFDQK